MQENRIGVSHLGIAMFVLSTLMQAQVVRAQACPGPAAPLSLARQAIHELSRNDRDPLAADCASRWLKGQALSAESLADENLVKFMTEAADRHRDAANRRSAENLPEEVTKYHQGEVALRQRFLKLAEEHLQQTQDDRALRTYIVKNLSALANAYALRGEYGEANQLLARAKPTYVDPAALSVWLKAVWSCAKFDGVKGNICAPSHREQCRDHVEDLLNAESKMTRRDMTNGDRRDISNLRNRISSRGCLQ